MIDIQLFNAAPQPVVRAGLIGANTFGLTLLAQERLIQRLSIPVVCDQDLEAAQQICAQAGLTPDAMVICENRVQIMQALERGQTAIVPDAMLLMDLPLDVIVEATHDPEAGARHAEAAIQHGKHVAMVNKETDVVVGSWLAQIAAQAGVVYTTVDGDQHGMLIELVGQARMMGLTIISGGKARTFDFILDEQQRTISNNQATVKLGTSQIKGFDLIKPGGNARDTVQRRRLALAELPQSGETDLCEAAIMANTIGLLPDRPETHAPILRPTEIPRVLCPQDDGGILSKPGVVDIITCLRAAHEVSMGGGVWLVVDHPTPRVWDFLRQRGLPSDARDRYGLLIRPYHLLGVETPRSLLAAGLLGLPTGGPDMQPRIDLVARTTQALEVGHLVRTDPTQSGTPVFQPLLLPAAAVERGHPLPFYMAAGYRLTTTVPAGTILTADMVEPDPDSRLWALRRAQDRAFGLTTA